MSLMNFDRIWFLTWTTYGTWLPGDARGFVSPKFENLQTEPRNNVPGTEYDQGRPALRSLAAENLRGEPIWLMLEQAEVLRNQFQETARHRGWTIIIGAIMANHIHLVVGVTGDPDPASLLRDFKSYGSRALNGRWTKPESGTWWTEQGSKRKVKDEQHLSAVIEYVRHQVGALVIWECANRSCLVDSTTQTTN
jgi:REP element-mobilizing transposase RayT